jgi:hypothetical protein
VLASSFIFASGLTQSVGKYILLDWNVTKWWMPFVTGGIFIVPTILFTLLLERTPKPDQKDIEERTQRLPMNKTEEKNLCKPFCRD